MHSADNHHEDLQTFNIRVREDPGEEKITSKNVNDQTKISKTVYTTNLEKNEKVISEFWIGEKKFYISILSSSTSNIDNIKLEKNFKLELTSKIYQEFLHAHLLNLHTISRLSQNTKSGLPTFEFRAQYDKSRNFTFLKKIDNINRNNKTTEEKTEETKHLLLQIESDLAFSDLVDPEYITANLNSLASVNPKLAISTINEIMKNIEKGMAEKIIRGKVKTSKLDLRNKELWEPYIFALTDLVKTNPEFVIRTINEILLNQKTINKSTVDKLEKLYKAALNNFHIAYLNDKNGALAILSNLKRGSIFSLENEFNQAVRAVESLQNLEKTIPILKNLELSTSRQKFINELKSHYKKLKDDGKISESFYTFMHQNLTTYSQTVDQNAVVKTIFSRSNPKFIFSDKAIYDSMRKTLEYIIKNPSSYRDISLEVLEQITNFIKNEDLTVIPKFKDLLIQATPILLKNLVWNSGGKQHNKDWDKLSPEERIKVKLDAIENFKQAVTPLIEENKESFKHKIKSLFSSTEKDTIIRTAIIVTNKQLTILKDIERLNRKLTQNHRDLSDPNFRLTKENFVQLLKEIESMQKIVDSNLKQAERDLSLIPVKDRMNPDLFGNKVKDAMAKCQTVIKDQKDWIEIKIVTPQMYVEFLFYPQCPAEKHEAFTFALKHQRILLEKKGILNAIINYANEHKDDADFLKSPFIDKLIDNGMHFNSMSYKWEFIPNEPVVVVDPSSSVHSFEDFNAKIDKLNSGDMHKSEIETFAKEIAQSMHSYSHYLMLNISLEPGIDPYLTALGEMETEFKDKFIKCLIPGSDSTRLGYTEEILKDRRSFIFHVLRELENLHNFELMFVIVAGLPQSDKMGPHISENKYNYFIKWEEIFNGFSHFKTLKTFLEKLPNQSYIPLVQNRIADIDKALENKPVLMIDFLANMQKEFLDLLPQTQPNLRIPYPVDLIFINPPKKQLMKILVKQQPPIIDLNKKSTEELFVKAKKLMLDENTPPEFAVKILDVLMNTTLLKVVDKNADGPYEINQVDLTCIIDDFILGRNFELPADYLECTFDNIQKILNLNEFRNIKNYFDISETINRVICSYINTSNRLINKSDDSVDQVALKNCIVKLTAFINNPNVSTEIKVGIFNFTTNFITNLVDIADRSTLEELQKSDILRRSGDVVLLVNHTILRNLHKHVKAEEKLLDKIENDILDSYSNTYDADGVEIYESDDTSYDPTNFDETMPEMSSSKIEDLTREMGLSDTATSNLFTPEYVEPIPWIDTGKFDRASIALSEAEQQLASIMEAIRTSTIINRTNDIVDNVPNNPDNPVLPTTLVMEIVGEPGDTISVFGDPEDDLRIDASNIEQFIEDDRFGEGTIEFANSEIKTRYYPTVLDFNNQKGSDIGNNEISIYGRTKSKNKTDADYQLLYRNSEGILKNIKFTDHIRAMRKGKGKGHKSLADHINEALEGK